MLPKRVDFFQWSPTQRFIGPSATLPAQPRDLPGKFRENSLPPSSGGKKSEVWWSQFGQNPQHTMETSKLQMLFGKNYCILYMQNTCVYTWY